MSDHRETTGYIVGEFDPLTYDTIHHFKSKFNYLPFKQLKINEVLNENIFKNRELQIDENIKKFNEISEKKHYGIMLPLSISQIGKMFKGIFLESPENTVEIEPESEPEPERKKTLLRRFTRKITKPFREFIKKKENIKTRKQKFNSESICIYNPLKKTE
jgi:hypothetical protein